MNNELFPNLFTSKVLDHPNKKNLSANGIVKVNIPLLYVLFEEDFTNSDFESEARQLVAKLRITLDRIKDFYIENSYGKFTFDFKIKTTLLPGNYQIAFEYSKNALNNLNSNDTLYSWDDNLTFQEFLDFGIPKADTNAFVLFFAKVDLTWGGVRNYNTPDAKFRVLDRTLNQFVCAQHILISELEPNGRGWTVAAHELGHTLRTPDLYNMNVEGFLGDVSFMGYDKEGSHFDAFLKLRFGWIQPKIISPCKNTEILHLGPIYQSKLNSILIYPDKVGYPDELFLLEVRLSNSTRWDGRENLFDKSLNSNQQGLFIYHINTLEPSDTQPRIDLEGGDQEISGQKLVAFNLHMRNSFLRSESKFYNENNSGLEIRIKDVNNSFYELEISWNYEGGTAEFNKIGGDAELIREKSFTHWRKTWHSIVEGSFGNTGTQSFLFYDKENGLGQFYTTNANSDIQLLGRTHNGWRKTWHKIIGGSFGRLGHTDLLFYDKENGVGEFYTTDGNGNIHQLGSTHSRWRKTWHSIVGGSFGGSGHTDLLFYDKENGVGEFYTTDGSGNIRQLGSTHNRWRKTWHSIVGGSFGRIGGYTRSIGYSDLLFYDKEHGQGVFYTVEGNGNMKQIGETHKGWRKTWDIILSIGPVGVRPSQLLFYDSFHGQIEVYDTLPNGKIKFLKNINNIRRSWDLIIGSSPYPIFNRLLFYDKGST